MTSRCRLRQPIERRHDGPRCGRALGGVRAECGAARCLRQWGHNVSPPAVETRSAPIIAILAFHYHDYGQNRQPGSPIGDNARKMLFLRREMGA